MSSSVITQQVQGLATATSPGLVGTGAQTWAGDKTLTGLVTASGGIINTGLTGANATAAFTAGSGKVGEMYSVSKSTSVTQNIPATTWTNIDSVPSTGTLGAGIWLLHAQVMCGGNVSTSDNGKQIALSEYSGTTTTDHVFGSNFVQLTTPTASVDGIANLLFIANYSSAKQLFLKVYLSVAANTAVFRYKITAVRLA